MLWLAALVELHDLVVFLLAAVLELYVILFDIMEPLDELQGFCFTLDLIFLRELQPLLVPVELLLHCLELTLMRMLAVKR